MDAVIVMDKHQEGKLKDQKLSRKNLIAAPEFKQQYLLPLHHLDASFQRSTLQLVIEKAMSLAELKDACTKFRTLEAIEKAFVRCTGMRNWQEVVEHFPSHSDESRLRQFQELNFRHQVPEVFKHYCQAALDSVGSDIQSSVSHMQSKEQLAMLSSLTLLLSLDRESKNW